MTSDPTDNVNATYDAENRIASASTTAGTFTYTYDAEGNRVEKSGGGSGTLYWYMTPGIVAESDLSGNLKSEYVFFNGERVARRDFPSGSVAYYFSDHLKTAAIITDSTGNISSNPTTIPGAGNFSSPRTTPTTTNSPAKNATPNPASTTSALVIIQTVLGASSARHLELQSL